MNYKSWMPSTKTRLKSNQVFIMASSILIMIVITLVCLGFTIRYEVESDVSNVKSIPYWDDEIAEQQERWYNLGREELWKSLNVNYNSQSPKNVLVFLVNGISPDILSKVRFYKHGIEAESMTWEEFPYLGRLKKPSSILKKCNLSVLATSLLGGVPSRNCSMAMNETDNIHSLLQQAQEIGLRTGFITNDIVTGDLISALYAHLPECDGTESKNRFIKNCLDSAQQLISTHVGQNINVILGGGRQTLVSNVAFSRDDPLDPQICISKDGRNRLHDWQNIKASQNLKYNFVSNAMELKTVKGKNLDYLLGILSNGALTLKSTEQINETSLLTFDLMVAKALEVLKRKTSGYLLFVENKIDRKYSNHEKMKVLAKFNEQLGNILNNLGSELRETLVVIAFLDQNFIESESYAKNKLSSVNDDEVLSDYLDSVSSDINVHATGPYGFLFHGVHEHTYLAHALSYASQSGYYRNKKE